MKRYVTLLGALLAGTLVPGDLKAGNSDDIPFGLSSSGTENAQILIDCFQPENFSSSKPKTITCRFPQTLIYRPDIEKRIAELNSVSQADFQKFVNTCGKNLQDEFKKDPVDTTQPPAHRERWDRLLRACTTKDATAVREALVWGYRNIDAVTCNVSTTMFSAEFAKRDPNTWVHTNSSTGACGATVTIILWRTKELGVWNFQQTTVVPPNVQDPTGYCKAVASTPVQDFNWKNRRVRELGCKYFEF